MLLNDGVTDAYQCVVRSEFRKRMPFAAPAAEFPWADVNDRFTPTNPCSRSILKLLADEESADVVFEVGQGRIHAHRLILRACAPLLADFCGGADVDGAESVVKINDDVDPEVFRHLICYVYGGKVPEQIFRDRAKDIINVADRFGIGGLKVEAEGWYVESTSITRDNFVDNFFFSDTKKLALLKEKVMKFMVQNEEEALEKLSGGDVPQSESLLTDMLAVMAQQKRKKEKERTNSPFISPNSPPNPFGSPSKSPTFWFLTTSNLKTLPINKLRAELDKKDQDVDGTREMLISTLSKFYEAGEVTAGTSSVNGIAEAVLTIIQTDGAAGDVGIHIDEISSLLSGRGFDENAIRGAVEHLSNEGQIYSTIDENHFQFAG